jgi:hypothetical protein
LRRAAVALLALAPFGCSPAEPWVPKGEPYVAFAKDFDGFRHWTATHVEPTASSDIHVSAARTVYANHLPDPGATTFDVGTMIVKEIDGGDVTARKVFAMVKRGGGYNPTGAAGWEWFELGNIDDERAGIDWRGVGPPAGGEYGGDPNGACNGCHGAPAIATDSVLSPGLFAQ